MLPFFLLPLSFVCLSFSLIQRLNSPKESLSYTTTNKKAKKNKTKTTKQTQWILPNAKAAYGLMMLLHASLAFISVEIRFNSEFADLSLEMGRGELDAFLVSSV